MPSAEATVKNHREIDGRQAFHDDAMKADARLTQVIINSDPADSSHRSERKKILSSLNDMGNADRFIKRHGNVVRYCSQHGQLLVYKDGCWVEDKTVLFSYYRKVIDSIKKDAEGHDFNEKEKDKILAHVNRSSSVRGFNGILNIVKNEFCMHVDQGQLDADPLLLNCMNETIHLGTGTPQPHAPENLITKRINAAMDPNAECPGFKEFINTIMDHDQEKIGFLQKLFGYSLTGLTVEQCLFIFFGNGSNGKSTLIEVFRNLLGSYAAHTPSSSLLRSKSSHNSNDIARLKGVRFVSAVEVGLGKRLDETRVKQITGGDKVVARFLFKEFFEYYPEFKLIIAANHLPEIQGVDDGIWRRIYLVPFDVSIAGNEVDKNLKTKLMQEFPGILNWALDGCKDWLENGLNPPRCIIEATTNYRNEMDQVAGFITDKCLVDPTYRVPIADLYEAYIRWASMAGQKPYGKITFGKIVKQKAYTNSGKSGSSRYWTGLKLC